MGSCVYIFPRLLPMDADGYWVLTHQAGKTTHSHTHISAAANQVTKQEKRRKSYRDFLTPEETPSRLSQNLSYKRTDQRTLPNQNHASKHSEILPGRDERAPVLQRPVREAGMVRRGRATVDSGRATGRRPRTRGFLERRAPPAARGHAHVR